MSRRLALILAAITSFAIVACNSAPAAPALSDPKEILVQSIGSLQNVKTVQLTGTFGGKVAADALGNFDLSTLKLNVAADIPGKKAHVSFDAPTLMGTNVDVITLSDSVYMKMTGPFAAMLGMDGSGKYVKTPVDSGAVPEEATDPAKAIEELRTSVDELPSAPQRLDDEKIGDADAYHVRIALSGADLAKLSPEAGSTVGAMTVDLWARKDNLRPARIGFSVEAGAQGTVTGTFDLVYDGSVDIAAPPADQVVEAP